MLEEREDHNEQQRDLPALLVYKPANLSIDGKPPWMMCFPGPRTKVKDDDVAFEEGRGHHAKRK